MAISNFPPVLQPLIQQGWLDHAVTQALRSRLAYRQVADREGVMTGIGESVTKTRMGLLPSATTPINVTAVNPLSGTAAKLDSGLTPVVQGIEQYTLAMNEYGSTLDLNVKTSQVGITNRFIQNAKAQAEQAARTMDELARNALFNAYLGGNTFVRTAASSSTSLAVDDVRGFLTVPVNGVQMTVSASTPLPIVIAGAAASVVGVAVDGTNASITLGGLNGQPGLAGMSGVLTLASAVTAAAGSAVQSTIAPTILRPNARSGYGQLLASDVLTMAIFLDAVATLRSNNVPDVGGLYNAYVDPISARQLFADPDFKQLVEGIEPQHAVNIH